MVTQTFEPITVTNILNVEPEQVAYFMNRHILSNKLPQFTPNHQVSIKGDLVPRLAKFANDRSYVTELYNIVISGYFKQKEFKRGKADLFDPDAYNSLEAKKEILYRTAQALDRLYEAASRLMTGIGQPDSNMNRY